MAAGYLTSILERKRQELAARPPAVVEGTPPAPRPFAAALRQPGRLAVIAEVKRRSPVKGPLALELDPVETVRRYADGGAAACSILTDSGFSGSLDDLIAARAATDLPLLRKDFLLDPAQCAEARSAGADAVLVIVAALEGSALAEMLAAAGEAGVEALVEVHAEDEVARALEAGATLVGVNNRNLQTFDVDLDQSIRLASLFPADVVRVSESGIATAAEARKVGEAGYHAVLVGEALVKAADPAALVREMGAACS